MIEQYITVAPGVDLRVLLRAGSDATLTPFVLVHGLASNALLWDGTARALSAAGHTVAAVDLRGHGRSSKPDEGYDFETIVADVVAVIAALGIDRPVVAGQSWGGNVIVELAATHAHTIRGAVAVDGGFIELADRFDTWESCRAALTPPRLIGMPHATIEQHIRSAHPGWPETGIQGALANFEVRDDGTIAPWLTLDRHLAILHALYHHRPSALFGRLDVPLLLVPADTGDVAWTHDKRAAVDAALGSLRDGAVHWFSPADHDIHAQFPDELADVLVGFATRLAPPEAAR